MAFAPSPCIDRKQQNTIPQGMLSAAMPLNLMLVDDVTVMSL